MKKREKRKFFYHNITAAGRKRRGYHMKLQALHKTRKLIFKSDDDAENAQPGWIKLRMDYKAFAAKQALVEARTLAELEPMFTEETLQRRAATWVTEQIASARALEAKTAKDENRPQMPIDEAALRATLAARATGRELLNAETALVVAESMLDTQVIGWGDWQDELGNELCEKNSAGELHIENGMVLLGALEIFLRLQQEMTSMQKELIDSVGGAEKNSPAALDVN